MIPESKFRCIKKEYEAGLELEELMEHRMAHGSPEWVEANKRLQYLYELVGAIFQRFPHYQSSAPTVNGPSDNLPGSASSQPEQRTPVGTQSSASKARNQNENN